MQKCGEEGSVDIVQLPKSKGRGGESFEAEENLM
jgi:hypothetical protein